MMLKMYEYAGNLHVHSTYSDGSGNIAEIAAAASAAGIDFVGINDHHTLAALKEGWEGWHENVLVLVGMENNHKHHHYLSYGVSEEVQDNTDDPQSVIDEVAAQRGIGFIAHPFEKGSRLVFGGHAYTWNDWKVTGFTGISIWNYSSQWRDGATSMLRALYQLYINRHQRINGACEQALAKLDEIAQQRHVTAIGGSDAHAVKIKYGPLSACIFPYQFLFRTVNTHVLLHQPLGDHTLAKDKESIYQALRLGRCFVAFDYYQSAQGFRFWAERGKDTIDMGEEEIFQDGWTIKIKLPDRGRVRLVHNGNVIIQQEGVNTQFPVKSPGVYRVEVSRRHRLKYVPWIYSNHIYFRD